MREASTNTSAFRNNQLLIIAVAAVVLVTFLMYLRDRQQQRTYELSRLEKRVELLEEWGMPRQNSRQNTNGRGW